MRSSRSHLVKPACLLLSILLLGLSGCAGASGGEPAQPGASKGTIRQAEASLLKMPLSFIQNKGQLAPEVSHYIQGAESSVYFTSAGLTYALKQPNQARYALKMDFVGAKRVAPVASRKTPATVNFFKGAPNQWKTAVPTSAGLVYRNLWPGIDLVYSGTGKQLKYEFRVAAGADPSKIKLAYRGADSLSLNARGQLQASSPAGKLIDERPYSYQQVQGKKLKVKSSYALSGVPEGGPHNFGFKVGDYDRTRPLVIDPAVFIYAGYIGGSGSDIGRGIAVDSQGAAYITGMTRSTEASFPKMVGPDSTFNGYADAFVAKISPQGNLVYAGYIGGSGYDEGRGIAVDATGSAYITGVTGSDRNTFPVTVGPDTSYNGSGGDAFVAKVSPSGRSLEYAGYIGGNNQDEGNSIAVDPKGAAYVTGSTQSINFPLTGGLPLPPRGGEAFVTKVEPGGAALSYSSIFGGSSEDVGNSIAVDGSGAAYVAGETNSHLACPPYAGINCRQDQMVYVNDFPVTGGPDLTFNGGGSDAFIAKVKPDGSGFFYAGFIGGGPGTPPGGDKQYPTGRDVGYGVAVDAQGAAYVSGWTYSIGFPVKIGPKRDPHITDGSESGFIAKVHPSGNDFVYSGYAPSALKASYASPSPVAVAVDAGGNAYLTGTVQTGAGGALPEFAATSGPDLTGNGAQDAFAARVKADGTGFDYAGFVGGWGEDFGYGIAVDAAGTAYIAGSTGLTDSTPFPATGGPDLSYNGGNEDAFVAKVASGLPAPVPPGPAGSMTLTPQSSTGQIGSASRLTATVRNPSGALVGAGIKVNFSVTGPNAGSRQVATNASGQAEYAYTGLAPGEDVTKAFADINDDGAQQDNEPKATATRVWTPGVDVFGPNELPTISVGDTTVNEGAGTPTSAAQFPVTLSSPDRPTQTAVVRFSAEDGSELDSSGTAPATAAGGDYLPTASAVSFAPDDWNQATKTAVKQVPVMVVNDSTLEPPEHFYATLNSPVNATLARAPAVERARAIVYDNAPTLSITGMDSDGKTTRSEGALGETPLAQFKVVLSFDRRPDETTIARFATADGLGPNSATAFDGDYSYSLGSTVSIDPAEWDPNTKTATKIISIRMLGDNKRESDEHFQVTLTLAQNATIATGANRATAIIKNDDP